jgi:membrane protein DedA with SNARE-associated domain
MCKVEGSAMGSLLGLLEHHTLALIFGWVLLEQAGVPVPSAPVMLAAGTLSSRRTSSMWRMRFR